MSSKSLVICDQEEKYASAFAAYLTKKKELALQVQVCSDPEQARKIQQEKAIDILLISSGYSQEMRKEIQAGSVFVLTETARNPGIPISIGGGHSCGGYLPVWPKRRRRRIISPSGKEKADADHRDFLAGTPHGKDWLWAGNGKGTGRIL